jgi:hypothetical protein
MSRVMPALARNLRRNTGVWSLMHRPGDIENEYELIAYIWNTPAIKHIRCWLDAFQTSKPGGYTYKRSTLFGFYLVALLLGLNLKDAHARVQSHDGLRKLFGLGARSSKFCKQQRKLGGRLSLPEDGFPARSTVDDFTTRWLKNVAPELDAMAEQAYEIVPLATILDHDLDPARISFDGTRVQSLRRYLRARTKQPDVGADWYGRTGEKSILARLKMSALLVDSGLVLTAEVRTPTSEKGRTREFLIPSLKARSDQLVELAASRSIVHPGFKGGGVAIDNQMIDNPIIGDLYDNGFRPCYPTGGARKHRGLRRLRDGEGRYRVREVTTKHEFLCRCDRFYRDEKTGDRKRTPIEERRAMLHERGRASRTGGFFIVRCADPVCPFHHKSRALHVALRGDDVMKKGRLHDGDRDLRKLLYLDNSTDRVSCIAFQGKQAIEAYHSCLQRFRLLGQKNGPGKRRMSGDFKNSFYYTLGDLIWNLTITFHLDSGVERPDIDWAKLDANRLRDDKKVERHKKFGKPKTADADDVEDVGLDPPDDAEPDLVPPADLLLAA